jgi:hypothetical protein
MPPVVIPSYTVGTLPSPGTPGSLARVTDSTRGVWMDQNNTWGWSPTAAGVVNAQDFDNLQAAVDSLGVNGGTVMLPPGDYNLTQPLDLDGRQHISLIGMGRMAGPSRIIYGGTDTRVISCRSSAGKLGIHNLQILYTNASFTGHVIDFEGGPNGSFLSVVSDCYLGSNNPSAVNATSLINLSRTYTMVIAQNNFAHCQTAILGRSLDVNFANGIQVLGNHFGSEIQTCCIRNAAQAWLIQGNTFQQRANGGAGVYQGSLGAMNVVFEGNWFGDASLNGTQINWLGYNLTVSNNYIEGGDTGIQLQLDSFGTVITGNLMASMNTAIHLGTTPQSGVVISGNRIQGVTTPIAGLSVAHENLSITSNSPSTIPTIIRGTGMSLQGIEGPTNVQFPSKGGILLHDFEVTSPAPVSGVDLHIRPHAGKRGVVTFTENGVDDRWAVGIKPGDPNLYFGTGTAVASTDRVIVRADGGVTMTGTPRFNASNTTGAGSASLGSNCPAVTPSAPYRWIGITTEDGSTAYLPCWK